MISLLFVTTNAWGEIYVQNDQKYIGDDGSLHIVGEIQNDLNVPVNQIEVFVTLYSDDFKTVKIVSTNSLANTIMPGMKAPFDLLIANNLGKNIQSYSLDIDYRVASPKSQVIEITSSDFHRDVLDNFIITGTVANRGEVTANTVTVIATLYDRHGDVIAVSKTHAEPDYLRVDDEMFFFVTVPDKVQSNQAVDFSLVAESEEYTAVPEFPIGSMILLASSVSGYLFFTRYANRSVANFVATTNVN